VQLISSTTDDAVPDFLGLSMREAVEKAQSMKINLKMQGNGYVVKQNPAPGIAGKTNKSWWCVCKADINANPRVLSVAGSRPGCR
jgi:hypothetical protein